MDSVDYGMFRTALRTALGEERFRKFVAAGVSPRLRYWQEVELKKFFDAHPGLRVDAAQLKDALSICELHDAPLQFESVEVLQGCIDYSAAYMRVRRESFPHAAADPVSSEGRKDMPPTVDIAYCPECRKVRTTWVEEQELKRAETLPAPTR